MNKLLFTIVILFSAVFVSAQEEKQIHILRNDGGINIIPQSEVDSITFSNLDFGDKDSGILCTQILYTKTKKYYIPVGTINEVLLNRQNGVESLYYAVEPAPIDSEWDSIMVTSNGYCLAIRTDSNNAITIAIDSIGAINNNKTIIAHFNADLSPISIITSNKVFNFVNYRDDVVDVITVENDEVTLITDISLNQNSNNSRGKITRGISQNHYAYAVSLINSVLNILGFDKAAGVEATMMGIENATQNGINADGKFVISLSGIGLTAVVAGLSWPAVVVGGLIAGWTYLEDVANDSKIQSYRLFAGNCEAETIKPEKLGSNSYRIGVKIKNSGTIPVAYEGYNTYGLVVKKVPVYSFPPYSLNIYDKQSEIIYHNRISDDGEFYVTLDVEPGYKYLYKAFVLPYGERISFECGKGSASSSFVYYGDIKQVGIDYAIIKSYSQKSVSCTNGKLKFVTEVTAEFKNTRLPNDISCWGICLFKDGKPVDDKDYSFDLNQTEGTATIEFEADKESMLCDDSTFIASTKEHWSIGTFVDFKGDDYYARHRSDDKESVDLVYNEKPSLTFTKATLGETSVDKDEKGNPNYCHTKVFADYKATGTFWVNTVDLVVIQGTAEDGVGYWDVVNDGEQTFWTYYNYVYGGNNDCAFKFDFVLSNEKRVSSSNVVKVWGSPTITGIDVVNIANSSRSADSSYDNTKKTSKKNNFRPIFTLNPK